MFTGIIEEIGIISNVKRTVGSFVLTIKASKIITDMHLGDSISINGVCLTVTDFSVTQFSVDVMPETLKATSLNSIKRGTRVNLERAVAATGRFGGHFISGHIDGTGIIKNKKYVENAVYYEIELDSELMNYIILRGSVAIDGTSLTVFMITENSFTISLIPLTVEDTIIGVKDVGDIVNIECDMMGKYLSHFLTDSKVSTLKKKTNITEHFLEEHGFM